MIQLPAGFVMRRASGADFSAVRAFYNHLIDDLLRLPNHPLWSRDGHPSDAYLRGAIEAGELWIAESAQGVAAAVVVNSEANAGYRDIPWAVQAGEGEYAVVHAFGDATCMQGKGLGTAMMQAVMEMARAAGKKSIRLDLIDHNRTVARVYTGMGFRKCGEVKLFYEEVGWQLFHLFEFAL